MALSGLHVVCGHADIKGGAMLMGALSWSQTFTGTLTSTVTTTQSAFEPNTKPVMFDAAPLCIEVTTSIDAWVAIGGTPDPTQASGTRSSARVLVRSGETRNLFCKPGDYVAAIAA